MPRPRDAVGEVVEIRCPACAARVRLRRKEAQPGPAVAVEAPPVGVLALSARLLALQVLEWAYHLGNVAGALVLLPLGGFVPVLRGWLRDEVADGGGVLEALGAASVLGDVEALEQMLHNRLFAVGTVAPSVFHRAGS